MEGLHKKLVQKNRVYNVWHGYNVYNNSFGAYAINSIL